MTFDDALDAERARRERLRDSGKPYHYWAERGDADAPPSEYWCGYCAGFFGVPHNLHDDGLCSWMGRWPGNRQCACIDCVVAERLHP